MTAHLETYATREAWFAARTRGFRIGGSAVPRILLPEAPYGHGPYSVWAEHHDPLPPTEETEAQAWGHADEPLALALYAQRTGIQVEHTPDTLLVHPEHPWVVCSPDGLVGEVGGAEVKHYDHPRWEEWAPSGAQWHGGPFFCGEYVALQACWSLLASNRLWWDAVVNLPSGRRYPDQRVYRFWRHEPTLADMLARVSAWRERHLVGGERPPYDSGDQHYEIVQHRYPKRLSKNIVAADETDEALMRRLADASARETAASAEVKLARAALAERIGGAAGLHGASGKVSWGDSRETRSISLNKIETTAPDLFEQLRARGLVTTGFTARALRFAPAKGAP